MLSLLSTNIAGAILSSLAYGIFIVLWAVSMFLMFNQLITSIGNDHPSPGSNRRLSPLAVICAALKRPMLLALIVLFLSNTTYWVCIVIRMFKAFADIPDATWPLRFLGDLTDVTMMLYNTFLGISLFICDAIVVYRLSVLWRHNYKVIAVAILLMVGAIVIMIGTAIQFTRLQGADIFNQDLIRWLSSSAVITFCTNGYCTALIAYRIGQFQNDTSNRMKGRLSKATAIFVESAALYMFWALAFLISYETHTNIHTAIVDLGPACAGIACTMITIRVGMGWDKVYISTNSMADGMQPTHVETLSLPQFSPNQALSTYSGSESIDATGSDSESNSNSDSDAAVALGKKESDGIPADLV
ncbi:hypothetical protein VKT23_006453 [Stygiomarasmius scandens]|uniref:Uncharacterized protein n=1 Tax=Marasmiellus scandens TaxID=2682957 RepID=A0ABR1JMU4_9AGAR